MHTYPVTYASLLVNIHTVSRGIILKAFVGNIYFKRSLASIHTVSRGIVLKLFFVGNIILAVETKTLRGMLFITS